jgi:hypothetical protein
MLGQIASIFVIVGGCMQLLLSKRSRRANTVRSGKIVVADHMSTFAREQCSLEFRCDTMKMKPATAHFCIVLFSFFFSIYYAFEICLQATMQSTLKQLSGSKDPSYRYTFCIYMNV